MNQNQISNETAYNIIGISIRTTNQAAFEQDTIQRLWKDFFTNDILSKIPHKIDDAIIALYYNYESNKDGAYSLLLGARVSTLDKIPTGLTAQHVPAQKTHVFTTKQGPLSNIVLDLWKNIWQQEDANNLDRSYQFDYEIYDERCHNPKKATMSIHIGVK